MYCISAEIPIVTTVHPAKGGQGLEKEMAKETEIIKGTDLQVGLTIQTKLKSII